MSVRRANNEREIEDDSPIKIYSAENGVEKVFLKIIDKELLKEEGDYDFRLSILKRNRIKCFM